MAKFGDIKKIKCLSPEQQDYYERITPRQRAFIDYRTAGYEKKASYIRAGYKASKSAAQAAWILENRDEGISGIIQTRLDHKMASGIYDPNSAISKQINSAVTKSNTNEILEVVKNASPEVAEQIQFYRNIVSGQIKTIRKTKNTDRNGIKTYKTETVEDVKAKMDARRELDRILGINKIVDIGSIEMGDITINIVDTSKQDRGEDETPTGSIYKSIEDDEIVMNEKDYDIQKVKEGDIGDGPKEAFFKRSSNGK
jgi:hypothetical protein